MEAPEPQKYPSDVEAKIFHALALNETFDHKSMAPLLKAIEILEPLDKKYPDHPGITHYLIHSYDFAPIAQRGIPAANKYAKVAPSAPHAQHMPSHIYSMVGMWDESIASNIASIKVANEYAAQAKLDGVLAGVPHSYDFMQYAYLQLGQDAKAKALIDESAAIKKVLGVDLGGQHGARRRPRTLLPRAAGLEGRRATAADRHALPCGRGDHAFRARAWARRAAATSPPRRPTSTS